MDPDKHAIKRVMRVFRKFLPEDESGENVRAVTMFGKMLRFKDIMNGKGIPSWLGKPGWPVTSGSYIVSDKSAYIAVCALTSPELMEPLSKTHGVAITGRLVTANLGIEKIIQNIISNPNIRYLLLCGKESPVFHPAQTLHWLFHNGVNPQKRILDAKGHFPVLNNLENEQIERFRQQVELLELTDVVDADVIREKILGLEKKAFYTAVKTSIPQNQKPAVDQFIQLRPSGERKDFTYDPNGYFVITVDHKKGKIILRHYETDNTPAHEIKARRADSILRGLIREGLLSQLSHAGYLGIELAKAETALRMSLEYNQDHPLKNQ